MPTVVVGDRDAADPGHPLALAKRYAEALSDATLVVEDEGKSPIAWQGGQLSRVIEELVARMRGLIRRSTLLANDADDPEVVVGDLVLNEDSHEVRRAGTDIELTATEFELLRFLMRNPRRVLSKAQILDRVWSYDFGGKSSVVEIYISYLRKKIDAGRSPMIHTVRGAGYLLKPAEQ